MLLITGITGFSGSFFLEELIKNHYTGPIRCITRNTSDTKTLDNAPLNIEKLEGDLGDQIFLDAAMEGVETVIHMGIFHSIQITKAAIKNNVKRLILIHTAGVYSKYKAMTAQYKDIEWHIDKIILKNKSDIKLVYLRPTMIFGHLNDGNMVRFIKMVDTFRLFPIIAHGKNLLQPVHGKDLGRGYYQVTTKSDITQGDYVLSGEKPITMLEILTEISLALGKKTLFIHVPLKLAVFMAHMVRLLTFGRVNYIEEVQRMGEDRHACHQDASIDFDYSPSTFLENLKAEVSAYQKKTPQNLNQ